MYSLTLNEDQFIYLTNYLDTLLDELIDDLDNANTVESKDFFISELYLCNSIKKKLRNLSDDPIYFE